MLLFRFMRPTVLISALSLAVTACSPQPALDHRATPEAAGIKQVKPVTRSKTDMVAIANPYAADAALEIFNKGGNALDAAIAAQMVLTLVEPQSSGIGGGGFLLLHDGKKLTSFDGRETAPVAIQADTFMKDADTPMGFFEAAVGGRAVGVPGLIKMLAQAHAQYGKLPWHQLFDPAITLAYNGFEISPRLHMLLSKDRFLRSDPTAKAYFYQTNGEPKPIGHLLKNKALAESLIKIAFEGSDGFYTGPIAQAIIDKTTQHQTNPGVLTQTDLSNYKAIERPPVCVDYKEWEICGMGAPSSGGLAVGQIFALLEPFDLRTKSTIDPVALHLFAEAQKLAFADRNAFVADPDHIPVPQNGLLNATYLKERSQQMSISRAMGKAQPGAPFLYGQAPHETDHGISTTHMSLVDKDGMVISMTTSIENAFGSRQMVKGFLLNNQLTDFSFRPHKDGNPIANRVGPNKRPRSSMAPTVVLNKQTGKPVLAIGSPGGSRIIGYVSHAILGVLDWKLPLNTALNRGHITNRNGATELESNSDAVNFDAALTKMGHDIKQAPMTSGLHAVQILPDGTLIGAADARREGVARSTRPIQ